MPYTIPNTFASQSGNVPAGQLDTNFSTLLAGVNNAFLVGLVSARPAPDGIGNGRYYFATDTQILYRDNGSAWVQVSATANFATPHGGSGFRLTLSSGVPVQTGDVFGATTLFFTPYVSDQIYLLNGAGVWTQYITPQISIAVPNVASQVYDVFVFDNAGTPTLELLAWTNDSVRATALASVNGALVKNGAPTRLYVGTIRTTTVAGQIEDSLARRFVWNYYNRVTRPLKAVDTTPSWNYTTATIRQANSNNSNQLDFVIGVVEDPVIGVAHGRSSNTGTALTASALIGFDTTTAAAQTASSTYAGGVAGVITSQISHFLGFSSALLGRHVLTWLEYSDVGGTSTFYGLTGSVSQTGILAFVRG